MRCYFFRTAMVVLAMVASSSSVQAGWIDTFDGGFDQTWVSDSITGVGGSSDSFTFTSVNNMLQVQDLTPAAALGAASGFGLVNEVFGYVVVGAVVNPGNAADLNREVGVLARINPANLTGYALTIDYLGDSGAMSLSRVDAGPNIVGLESTTLSGFSSADSLYIELQGIGDHIIGRTYDSFGGTLLAEIDAFDAAYAGGWAGVVVNSQDNPTVAMRGTYDMVFAGIPEPSSVVIWVLGCLCALGFGWRRRQCRS